MLISHEIVGSNPTASTKNKEYMEYKNGKKALVIGKFMPFHKGHKELIEFASIHATCVKILVLGNADEPIDIKQRVQWIEDSFDLDYSLGSEFIVKPITYDPSKLNSSSVSDVKSSEEWCEFLKDELEDIDVIIGSEIYVKYMAEYSKKEYLLFDLTRTKIPISATQIKENPLKYWDYLTPAVKRSYAHHICICGTESSGKTTLATALEKEFDYVTMIPEIGRCLVGNAMTCEPTTLTAVLSIHKTLLKRVMQNPPTPIVVWDTDNLTTKSYMEYLGWESYTSDLPIADIYFFLDSKIPYEKDVTRVDEEVAEKLKNNHLNIYKKEGVNLYVLKDKNNLMDSMKQYIKEPNINQSVIFQNSVRITVYI